MGHELQVLLTRRRNVRCPVSPYRDVGWPQADARLVCTVRVALARDICASLQPVHAVHACIAVTGQGEAVCEEQDVIDRGRKTTVGAAYAFVPSCAYKIHDGTPMAQHAVPSPR